ncbi:MAG: hypothetical protein ACRDXB_14650, partial [Actinomycetes bacterium]
MVVVPAGFARAEPAGLAGVEHAGGHLSWYGPLVSRQGLLHVVGQRVDAALHDLSHGHDGIAAGLEADHGHGYAHSHAFEEGGGGHTHTHSHPHTHTHPHPGTSPPSVPGATRPGTASEHDEPNETSTPDASHDEVLTSRL